MRRAAIKASQRISESAADTRDPLDDESIPSSPPILETDTSEDDQSIQDGDELPTLAAAGFACGSNDNAAEPSTIRSQDLDEEDRAFLADARARVRARIRTPDTSSAAQSPSRASPEGQTEGTANHDHRIAPSARARARIRLPDTSPHSSSPARPSNSFPVRLANNRPRTTIKSRETSSTVAHASERPSQLASGMSGPRNQNIPPRQAARNAIVQRWEPNSSRRNGASANGTAGAGQRVQAPPTPPTNAEDARELKRRELEHQIQMQVDEAGIEPPKGYTVSYHYNKRVENMHFGRTHPMKPWRLTLTKQLVMAYGLHFAMDNYESMPASKENVAEFHDPEYVDFLSKVSPKTFEQLSDVYANRIPHGSADDIVKLGPFNLSTSPGADCPVFDGMSEYLFLYTGATLEAARTLVNQQSDIAINWSGGLHHAHKAEASGFCYINDIVLAILELLKVHQRVLYIDIDVHHGDGVEEAFNSSDRVMTISFHRHGLVADVQPPHLFFPGTGNVTDIGAGMGKHFALNVPIKAGINDDDYVRLFSKVVGRALETFRPGAIVLQCGADSLGGDRLGQFNLNIKAHGECLAFVKRHGVPLLVLGGGGYTARNVARAWCHETALAAGVALADDLPMHILPRPQAFQGRQHGDAKLYPDLKGFHANDCNRKELDGIVERCFEELRYVQHAPSVVCASLPSQAEMERIRRLVDEEFEHDRAEESRRGEAGRKRRERNTGGRGEYR